jgi:hypothetical protein
MKRFKILDLRLMILVTLFFLFINHQSLIINPTFAADATPSSIVQSKLDELKKQIASKAAALKLDVNKRMQNKAYVGIIKTKSTTSITVAAKSGSKIINTNQDTIYQGTAPTNSKTKKAPAVNFGTLKEEDHIVALGDIDDTGVLTAKKIILLPTTTSELKTHLWGEVTSISGQNVTIKLKDSKSNSILVSNSTNYKLGIEDASLSDLKVNQIIIASGLINDNQILEADFIYIIPVGSQTPKPSQIASSSATPKASSKATPKPTKSPSPTPKAATTPKPT